MSKFVVIVTEALEQDFTIEADSPEDALAKAKLQFSQGKIKIDPNSQTINSRKVRFETLADPNDPDGPDGYYLIDTIIE